MSDSRIAQIRSEPRLVSGVAWSDFLHIRPTQPRTSSECSFSLLSDTPEPSKSGWMPFSEES